MIEGLSVFRKFKSYVGLKGSSSKLDRLIEDYSFVDLKEADKSIDWSKSKIINLNDDAR